MPPPARCRASSVSDSPCFRSDYKGALTEQYVQQELRVAADAEPFYWTTPDSRTETDFLFELSGLVIPVEAKAALNLRAKSLKSYIDRFSPPLSVRTSLAPPNGGEGNLLDLPLFAIGNLPSVAACHGALQGALRLLHASVAQGRAGIDPEWAMGPAGSPTGYNPSREKGESAGK